MLGIAAATRLALVGAMALAFGLVAAGANNTTNRETYVVAAGATVAGRIQNDFLPETIRVHSGDRIVWEVVGPHNIHLHEADYVRPRTAPTILANIEPGSEYRGGDVNSGMVTVPATGASFSLVMSVEPGLYEYVCDIHREMSGVIEVVPDDVALESPELVVALVRAQLVQAEQALVRPRGLFHLGDALPATPILAP